MVPIEPSKAEGTGGGAFVTTHWSLIVASRANDPGGAEALDRLCRTYWPPLFAYARRDGLPVHDAQDAVQGFLSLLLAREDLNDLTPEKGRFRSFLLRAFKNYLISRARGAVAAKRGGGAAVLQLETESADLLISPALADDLSPDRAFDRAWAQRILECAFRRLAAEHRSPAQARLFEALKCTLMEGERLRGGPAIAEELGMTAGALATAATRLRQRYRAFIEEEVRQTLVDPADLPSELAALWSAWS